MNIDIILEGKLKEPYYKECALEFKKRISGYLDIKIVETSNIDNYINSNLKGSEFVITLEIEGKMLSSVEFAKKLRAIENEGFYNKIVFLIGGANGLSDYAKSKSNFKFSMSMLTFLHQEALAILIEQIYRALKILKNEPYHK